MSACIKPSIFSFDDECKRISLKKIRNSQNVNINPLPIRDNMKDTDFNLRSFRNDKVSKYFSLSVTSKNNCSLCEVTETLPCIKKGENLERSRFIEEFYVRKKTLNKLKVMEKNRSLNDIVDLNEVEESEKRDDAIKSVDQKVRTVYYCDRQSSNFMPKTLKTFMRAPDPPPQTTKPEIFLNISIPSQINQQILDKKVSKQYKIPKKFLPKLIRRKSRHNNCISIQTDDHL